MHLGKTKGAPSSASNSAECLKGLEVLQKDSSSAGSSAEVYSSAHEGTVGQPEVQQRDVAKQDRRGLVVQPAVQERGRTQQNRKGYWCSQQLRRGV